MSHHLAPFGATETGIPDLAADKPFPLAAVRGRSVVGQPHDLRKVLRSGQVLLGAGMFMPTTPTVRLAALAGFDFLFVDWEHAQMTAEQVTEYTRWVHAASEGRTAAIVRLPNHEHHYAAWVLDAGASGVIFPHSETAEQAVKAVAACRFPKERGGHRSWPPCALFSGLNDADDAGGDRFDIMNRAAVFMQVESVAGAENAEAMAAVDGVDGLMLGLGDLTLDVQSRVPADQVDAEISRCRALLSAASVKHGKPILGIVWTPEMMRQALAENFRAIVVGNDWMTLARGFRDMINDNWALINEFNSGRTPHAAAQA